MKLNYDYGCDDCDEYEKRKNNKGQLGSLLVSNLPEKTDQKCENIREAEKNQDHSDSLLVSNLPVVTDKNIVQICVGAGQGFKE